MEKNGWPADAGALQAAREFIDSCSGPVVVTSHNDVDGLASAAIVLHTLRGRGIGAEPLPTKRGEHVHQDGLRTRIRGRAPASLVVLDMGSRPGAILPGVPKLVIDHHDASRGLPEDALVVNGYDREPVAPTSVLAFVVCCHRPDAERFAWLAALGAIADLGSATSFKELLGLDARGSRWSKVVSLLNAARRAPEDDAMAALNVLMAARDIDDIARGRVDGVERLDHYRRAVQVETDRCSRVAPVHIGEAALIRFASEAHVHPLVAIRWSRRLAPAIVIAANEGFIPGRVNFAIRNATDRNLLEWLRGLPFTASPGAEYANGHPRATGGSLSAEDFERFVDAVRASGAARADGSATRRRTARR